MELTTEWDADSAPRASARGRRARSVSIFATGILMLVAGCRSAPEPAPEPDPVAPPATPVEVPVEAPVDPGWEIRFVDTAVRAVLPEPFIKHVDLDLLRVGMTKEEVLAIFPDPFEIELRRDDELWQYGFAELIFRGNRLRDWFNLE
jgi:hypothetical protein